MTVIPPYPVPDDQGPGFARAMLLGGESWPATEPTVPRLLVDPGLRGSLQAQASYGDGLITGSAEMILPPLGAAESLWVTGTYVGRVGLLGTVLPPAPQAAAQALGILERQGDTLLVTWAYSRGTVRLNRRQLDVPLFRDAVRTAWGVWGPGVEAGR